MTLWPTKCEENYLVDSVRLCSAFHPPAVPSKVHIFPLEHHETMGESVLPFSFHLTLPDSPTILELSISWGEQAMHVGLI